VGPTDQHSSTSTAAPTSAIATPPTGAPVDVGSVRGDAGMATAEYAIATLAACGFAGLLVAILTSGEVRGLLLGIVQRALTLG